MVFARRAGGPANKFAGRGGVSFVDRLAVVAGVLPSIRMRSIFREIMRWRHADVAETAF